MARNAATDMTMMLSARFENGPGLESGSLLDREEVINFASVAA
jgi:hypothetical protein